MRRIRDANRVICLCCVCAVASFMAHGCATLPQARNKADSNDRALAILSIEPLADYADYDDPNEYWDDMAAALNMEFWRLCWSEDYRNNIERLARQFGSLFGLMRILSFRRTT